VAEGLIVRPVRRRGQGEINMWINRKSLHFLEQRPDELRKSLQRGGDFARLYLHLCEHKSSLLPRTWTNSHYRRARMRLCEMMALRRALGKPLRAWTLSDVIGSLSPPRTH
jgi:hypothetical protein